MNQIQVTTTDEFRTFAEEYERYIYSLFNIDPPEPEIPEGEDEPVDRVDDDNGILKFNVFSYGQNNIPLHFDIDIDFDPQGNQMIFELGSLSLDSPFIRNRGHGTSFMKHFVKFHNHNKFPDIDIEQRIHPSGFGSFMLYVKHGFNINFDSDSELIMYLQLLIDNGIDDPEHFLFDQRSSAYKLKENYIAWSVWMDSHLSSGILMKEYFCGA